jgi:hypothetical protein
MSENKIDKAPNKVIITGQMRQGIIIKPSFSEKKNIAYIVKIKK